MKGFLRSLSLLLVGAAAGVGAYCHYFNIPLNFNPITIVNTGDGDVEVDNRVTQGVPPAPTPSPAATPAPAATPTKTAENEPAQSAPTPEPRRPEVAKTDEYEPEEVSPEPAPVRRRSPRPAMAYDQAYEEQPRPVYTSFPQPQPVRQRSCPIGVVRRAPSPAYAEAYEEPQPQPTYPNRTHSRSYSSSVVTVNGRVVSSSSVTIVNGRVVSRSGSPSTPVDDDDEW